MKKNPNNFGFVVEFAYFDVSISLRDGPDPFCEKTIYVLQKKDFIFGWAPYKSYSNLMSIMLLRGY